MFLLPYLLPVSIVTTSGLTLLDLNGLPFAWIILEHSSENKRIRKTRLQQLYIYIILCNSKTVEFWPTLNGNQLLVNCVGKMMAPEFSEAPVITLDICMWKGLVDRFCVFKQYR